ncbi:YjhX family toxin [Alloyangia pacifica]|uniref:YjhX family toxin n=1 Tax=Alloyangia pacifica TaxID=311180 RepID=UPI001CD7B1FD|nr:YjhX family toxin [Alloyangia pacifica]MCA0994684.1 YjhX family toxin [Alloyangia pacifica]
MNISKPENRVLHVLAQGGRISHERCGSRITDITCITTDGMILSSCSLEIFQRLRRKRLVASKGGGAYRISERGRRLVAARPDNRV